MVQNLAENPLAKLEKRRDSKSGGNLVMSPIRAIMRRPSERQNTTIEETALLENVLMKISQLLQIGKEALCQLWRGEISIIQLAHHGNLGWIHWLVSGRLVLSSLLRI